MNSVEHQAWLNGALCDSRLIHDRGLMYGDGFFTTLLCNQQQPLNWSAHWQRLETSAQRLGFPKLDQADIEQQLSKVTSNLKDFSIIKLVITRGAGPGYAAPLGLGYQDLTRIISVSPVPLALQASIRASLSGQPSLEGLRIVPCRTPISINERLAGIKHLNRLDQVLARSELPDLGADEGLMLDSQGQVICGTQSNLVLMQGQDLISPFLDQSGVYGTCLKSLPSALEQAGLNYRWHFRAIKLVDLFQADAVFMCNAVRGIQPVASLLDKNYDLKYVLPIYQAWWRFLLAAYNEPIKA
ncbi:aminodeoxychorismate lyase [Thiomicrospira microaerophila]|uniref:aminodeoxychorismate lyase n=1 Tax=Thiomicrospira microaerophila TaxID=406020 RepID=UPI002010725F|nr:aminodeoxychorismate lyase [Thiomicrospira microaerophila]UQB42784.1 aminodeoxychorismate lyase [Thiomicrospira microaerophila]